MISVFQDQISELWPGQLACAAERINRFDGSHCFGGTSADIVECGVMTSASSTEMLLPDNSTQSGRSGSDRANTCASGAKSYVSLTLRTVLKVCGCSLSSYIQLMLFCRHLEHDDGMASQ
jgi:hypothetical protein